LLSQQHRRERFKTRYLVRSLLGIGQTQQLNANCTLFYEKGASLANIASSKGICRASVWLQAFACGCVLQQNRKAGGVSGVLLVELEQLEQRSRNKISYQLSIMSSG
jgi:hypothetical protein